MRLIIAGSRDLRITSDAIYSTLAEFPWRGLSEAVIEVVSGGAGGADASGERWAHENRLAVRVFPADWSTGKHAGPIRNESMARYADAAIIFCKSKPTPGSSNMAAWMLALNKPVRLVLVTT